MYARILINYCILLHFCNFIPSYNLITILRVCYIINCYLIDINSINSKCISGIAIEACDRIMKNFGNNLDIVQSSSVCADMFLKMVLHVQSDQRIASPYRASSFSGSRRKKENALAHARLSRNAN